MNYLFNYQAQVDASVASWIELEEVILQDVFSIPRSGSKAGLIDAYSRLCINHCISSLILVREGLLASGRTLLRPALDAYCRQLWVSFGCDDKECDILWSKMQDMALATREGREEDIDLIDKEIGNRLSFGRVMVNKLSALDIPTEVSFNTEFKKLFERLNSAAHGGLGMVATLLTKEGPPSEPDFCQEHLDIQLALLCLRVMSLKAMLVVNERNFDASRVEALYQQIVSEAKNARRALPPINWSE